MIVGTKACDIYLRQFGEKAVISKIGNLLPELAISPEIHNKEIFVFTNEDIKNKKLLEAFKVAVDSKDPSIIIIFIDRKGKALDIGDLPGVDQLLVKPNPEKVKDAIAFMLESISDKAAIKSSADKAPSIEEFKPSHQDIPVVEVPDQADGLREAVQEAKQEVEELSIFVEKEKEEPAKKEEEVAKDDFVSRIKNSDSTANISQLSKELQMSSMLKELARENYEFKSLSDRLRIIETNIKEIMIDVSKPLEVRLSEVRALMIDKQVYHSKVSTIIEEQVSAIITIITTRVNEVVSARLKEIDNQILRITQQSSGTPDFSKVTGLLDTRTSVLVELSVLDREVRDIFFNVDKLSTEVVASIGDSDVNLTRHPLLDAQLRAKGVTQVSENSIQTIYKLLSELDKSNSEFRALTSSIEMITAKMYKLLELDNEVIKAQQEVIKWLHANRIEDTVVANDLLKKSLRIFTGFDCSGVTAVPLVLSHIKSRTSSNTLIVDLRRRPYKYEEYGIEAIELDTFLEAPVYKQFCIVTSTDSNAITEGFISKVEVELTKAADYYRVINIIVDAKELELFQSLVNHALVVNYIVHPEVSGFHKMAEVVRESKVDNVARRIIINKSTEVGTILGKLGLDDDINIGVISIPYIEQLPLCNLRGIQPYLSQTVLSQFEESSKYA